MIKNNDTNINEIINMVKKVHNSIVHRSRGFKICDNCRCIIKDGEDYALTGEYNDEIKLCRKCFKVIPLTLLKSKLNFNQEITNQSPQTKQTFQKGRGDILNKDLNESGESVKVKTEDI